MSSGAMASLLTTWTTIRQFLKKVGKYRRRAKNYLYVVIHSIENLFIPAARAGRSGSRL